MTIKLTMAAAATVAAIVSPMAAQALTIDDFDTAQARITVTENGTTSGSSSISGGADIIGVERDMRITIDPGTTTVGASVEVSSGRAFYENGPSANSTVDFQWDGADNSFGLNPTGLGAMDLTDGNASDAFEIHFLFDDLPATITLTVHSNASDSSTATFPTTGGLFGGTGVSLFMPFAAFTTASGGGADFTSVGAIQLSMTSPVAAPDISIDYIQTTLEPIPLPPALLLFGSSLLGLALRGRRG